MTNRDDSVPELPLGSPLGAPRSADEQLTGLLAAATEGEWSAEQSRQLDALLTAHPRLVEAYVAHVALHHVLAWELQTAGSEPPARLSPVAAAEAAASRGDRPVPSVYRSATTLAGWAVLAVCVTLMAMAWLNLPGSLSADDDIVAVLLESEDAVWSGEEFVLPFGMPVARGQRFQLQAGLARLALEAGAGFVVEGPADFTLLDGRQVLLQQGRLVAHVPEGADGFTVVTQTAEIVDFGTRFVATVDDGNATDVYVLEGEVEARPLWDAGRARRLTTDEAVRIGADDLQTPATVVAHDTLPEPPRLDQLLLYRPWDAARASLRLAADGPPAHTPPAGPYTAPDLKVNPAAADTIAHESFAEATTWPLPADSGWGFAPTAWQATPGYVSLLSPPRAWPLVDGAAARQVVALGGRAPGDPLLANRLSRRLADSQSGELWFRFFGCYEGLDDNDFFVLWFDHNARFDASHAGAPSVGIKQGRFLARIDKPHETYGPAAVDGQPFELVGRLSKQASRNYNRLVLWIDPRRGVDTPPDVATEFEPARGVGMITHIGIRLGQDTEADDRLLLGALWLGPTRQSLYPAEKDIQP